MTTIKIVDQLSSDIVELMEQDLIKYERERGIDVNYKRFSYQIVNDQNQTLGALNAFTAFSEIYIDDMWIHEAHRGKGLGKKLITTLEENFKGLGFNNINLVTNAFQAPEFYKKCGFELEFTRHNLTNPSLTKYFFIKYFDEPIQTQGIVSGGPS